VTTEPPVLLVLAGPAGSGKSTLCDRLVKEIPGFARVVTTTTRAPRPGEVDGVHYHFLTPEQFDELITPEAVCRLGLPRTLDLETPTGVDGREKPRNLVTS